jgi:hypothetical protein
VTYTLVKWSILSAGEGWGVVLMYGLGLFGLVILAVDLILTLLIRNKWMLNIIEIIIAILFTISLIMGI